VHKRTEATVKGADGKQFKVAKGAPQVILQMATNIADVKAEVDKAVNDFAARGSARWRGRADQDDKWQFVGVLPMSDPPRGSQGDHAQRGADGRESQNGHGDQLAIAKEMSRQLAWAPTSLTPPYCAMLRINRQRNRRRPSTTPTVCPGVPRR